MMQTGVNTGDFSTGALVTPVKSVPDSSFTAFSGQAQQPPPLLPTTPGKPANAAKKVFCHGERHFDAAVPQIGKPRLLAGEDRCRRAVEHWLDRDPQRMLRP